MKRYTTDELIELADGAIIALEKELKPKAEEYFVGAKTTEFFKARITALKSIRKELGGEPRFVVHLLGSAQNGKSTLINVLIGKKILTEGHVGACSAAVVRCRFNADSHYRMTVRYVEREQFLKSLAESIKEAETAWGGEDPPEKRGEELRKALGRFVGFFGLGELSPPDILKTCQKFLESPKSIEFQQFGQTIDVPVSEQDQVDEHLAARGRKAFVVDECVLEGPFPEWPPQLELVDMPGTNDVDAFRTEVTEATKTKVSGLMLVTKGTLLGGDIIRWFKDTAILEEIADSTERNQQRLMVVRTVVDEQELEDLPETAESEWPYLERHCRKQEAQYRTQSTFPSCHAAFARLVPNRLSQQDVLWARFSGEDDSFDYEQLSRFTYHNLNSPESVDLVDKYIKGQDFPIVVIEGFSDDIKDWMNAGADQLQPSEVEQLMWQRRRQLYICASRATTFLFFVMRHDPSGSNPASQEIANLVNQLSTPHTDPDRFNRTWRFTITPTHERRRMDVFTDSL